MPCSERLASANHLTKRCRERGNQIKGNVQIKTRLGSVRKCWELDWETQVSCIVCSVILQCHYWIYTATTVVQYKLILLSRLFSDSKQKNRKPFFRESKTYDFGDAHCVFWLVFHKCKLIKCYHNLVCLVLLFTILDLIYVDNFLNDHETLFNSLKLYLLLKPSH